MLFPNAQLALPNAAKFTVCYPISCLRSADHHVILSLFDTVRNNTVTDAQPLDLHQ